MYGSGIRARNPVLSTRCNIREGCAAFLAASVNHTERRAFPPGKQAQHAKRHFSNVFVCLISDGDEVDAFGVASRCSRTSEYEDPDPKNSYLVRLSSL